MPHVRGIRDEVVINSGKVAALTGIHRHCFDGCSWVPRHVKVAQVEVKIIRVDLAIHILEVSEYLTSGDCSKAVKVMGQGVDVN